MKMKQTHLIGAVFIWACAVLVCYAETNTYTFVGGQSTVLQTGGIGGIKRTYQVVGRFQLTVDFSEKVASFDWVDAVLMDGAYRSYDLGELFCMTDVVGTVVDNTTIRFELLTNVGSFDYPKDYHLVVTLQGSSARLDGSFCDPVIDGFCYQLAAVAAKYAGGWTYEYLDDFATDKAKKDSYTHSVFWPQGAFPASEPYLFFSGAAGSRALAFMDYQGQPAHIGYCFPLGPSQGLREVKGTLAVDVALPNNADISQSPPGYMLFSFSSDGHTWTTPAAMEPGHHSIPIASLGGMCYVVFLGTRATIDNLEVQLSSSPATIYVPRDFATIQAAIDAAADGDVIEVAPGVYSGLGNRDIEFRGKAITVRSAVGAEQTIIDCGAKTPTEIDGTAGSNGGDAPGAAVGGPYHHRGFYFHENEKADSVLRGFTIISGRIRGSDILPDHMRWGLSPTHPIGGGIYCEFSSPTIVNCVIRDCGAELGGGIGCVGGEPTVVDCLIEDCVAGGFGNMRSGGRGAGIGLIRGATAKISGCVIRKNRGYYNSQGGGIYSRRSAAVVKSCDISLNASVDQSAVIEGAGVYCGRESDVQLLNCIISNNAGHTGAGIFAFRYDQPDSDLTWIPRNLVGVINCTVANNRLVGPQMPPFPGGGIHSLSADITVKNSIVWYNQGTQAFIVDAPSKSPVVYSDVQGGYLGQGNINEPPLFAPTAVPDYHLQSVYGRYDPRTGGWVIDQEHSPCIDAGDPQDAVGNEPTPNGGRINMGTYGGTLQASKGMGRRVYHVDGVNGDDSNDGLTRAKAFATIQRAIAATRDGDAVMVWPAVYREEVDFGRKAITVQSADDAAVVAAPQGYAFSFFKGEGGNSVLRNFIVRGGEYGIFCNGASPTLTNLTIVGNVFGIAAYEGADPNITNCILWNNAKGDLFQCRASYSCFKDAQPSEGQGNINDDPLFADANNSDYHLHSEHGRYWPQHSVWVIDEVSSLCIDAGTPGIFPRRERMPNGGRLNMGAYGGTPYASMSLWPLRGDINHDGLVNMKDLAILAEDWLESFPWVPSEAPKSDSVGPMGNAPIALPVIYR